MSHTLQTDQWPNIADLFDQPDGHISIGRMSPIEGAAIGKALHEGAVTNEINGGRFRLAPSSIRKKR